MKICPNCNSGAADEARFCNNCGNAFPEAPQTPVQTPAPEAPQAPVQAPVPEAPQAPVQAPVQPPMQAPVQPPMQAPVQNVPEKSKKKTAPVIIAVVAVIAVIGIVIGVLFATGVLGSKDNDEDDKDKDSTSLSQEESSDEEKTDSEEKSTEEETTEEKTTEEKTTEEETTEDKPSDEGTSITRGEFNGIVYTNDSVGITLTLDDGWQFASDEQIAESMSLGAEVMGRSEFEAALLEKTSMIDMLAMDSMGSSVNINFINIENAGLGKVTAKDYLEASLGEFEKIETMEFIQSEEIESVKLGSQTFEKLSFDVNVQGVSMKMSVYARIVDSHICYITIGTVFSEISDIEAMFS